MIKDVRGEFPVPDVWFRKKRPGGSADVTVIAIHYTYTSISASATEVEELEHMLSIHEHHKDNGGVPYHGMAFPSGRRYYTFDMSRWGSNVYKQNDKVIGFAGVFKHGNTPSLKTREGLAELIQKADVYTNKQLPLKGHRELISTACPGASYASWVPDLRELMGMTDAEKARLAALEAALTALKEKEADHWRDTKSAFGRIRAALGAGSAGPKHGWTATTEK